MQQPKVSVILTSYNKRHMLGQAIASVLAQTYTDWELFIVDDHSTDGSYQLASAFLLPNVYLMQTDLPKHGVPQPYVNRYAHNINLAFPKTKGDYITYLCDDDIYLPWRLEVMAAGFSNHDVHVVYDKPAVSWKVIVNGSKVRQFGPNFLSLHGIMREPYCKINHNSVMHRRECFEKVGGWDESAPGKVGDGVFFSRLAQHWDFYPVDKWMEDPVFHYGELFRIGGHNTWTGKVVYDASDTNVDRYSKATHSIQSGPGA